MVQMNTSFKSGICICLEGTEESHYNNATGVIERWLQLL